MLNSNAMHIMKYFKTEFSFEDMKILVLKFVLCFNDFRFYTSRYAVLYFIYR